MSKNRIKELQKAISTARDELYKLEEAESKRINTKLIGTYWKYRNSYGGGNPDERWWMYWRIDSIYGVYLSGVSFQTDYRGEHSIEPSYSATHTDGWEQITETEFDDAKAQMMDMINKEMR